MIPASRPRCAPGRELKAHAPVAAVVAGASAVEGANHDFRLGLEAPSSGVAAPSTTFLGLDVDRRYSIAESDCLLTQPDATSIFADTTSTFQVALAFDLSWHAIREGSEWEPRGVMGGWDREGTGRGSFRGSI